MMDRVRIRALRDAGRTLKEIADTVGVGQRPVQRILKEPRILSAESAPTPVSRGVGRPSTVAEYGEQVERILEEEPALPTVEVLSRLHAVGTTVIVVTHEMDVVVRADRIVRMKDGRIVADELLDDRRRAELLRRR